MTDKPSSPRPEPTGSEKYKGYIPQAPAPKGPLSSPPQPKNPTGPPSKPSPSTQSPKKK